MKELNEYKLSLQDVAVICSAMQSYVRNREEHIEVLAERLDSIKAAAANECDLPTFAGMFPDDGDTDQDEETAAEISRLQAAIDEAKKELDDARAIRLKTDMIRAFYEKFLEEGALK